MSETAGGAALPRCVILGGGGHARVLLDCIAASGAAVVEGILDADARRAGASLQGVPFLGGDDRLGEVAARGVTHFVVGVGGAGDNGPRRRLFELARSAGLSPLTVRHPSAVVSPWSVLGAGCQLLPGSIVNAGAVLGQNVLVNSGAVVEHDCAVGDHAHIATGAVLASTVTVGEGAHVGAGATVRQCLTIGAGAVVGAGAAVVRSVPPGTMVAGVPARRLGGARE